MFVMSRWLFRPNLALKRALAVNSGAVKLTVAVTHEDPWFVARCLEVDVASQGGTSEEALENLKEALELYFEDTEMPAAIEPPIISTIELSA